MEERKLYKKMEGKKVCGVCAGFAEYLRMDVTILRVMWALISIFFPLGVIAYFVCALIMPFEYEG